MTMTTIELPGLCISAPDGWIEITTSDRNNSYPITVADPEDGVGAIQLSLAIYKRGPLPSPSTHDLASMVQEFGDCKRLGEPFATTTFSNGIAGAAASYRSGDDFIRVWYVSDGKSIALITYLCDWDVRFRELDESEKIVRSIRFT